MKVQLSNGLVVEGTLQNILDVVRALHLSDTFPVYHSETQGPLLIAAMETSHIKNAILKKIRLWCPSGLLDEDVVKVLQSSPLQNDVEFQNLRAEFLRRMGEAPRLTDINMKTVIAKLRK